MKPRTLLGQDWESLYRRHAGTGLAYLSARLAPADCAAIHRDIWSRIVTPSSGRRSAATIRELLVAHAAARCGEKSHCQFEEHAEPIRRQLAELDGGVAQLIRLRLANHGFTELAQLRDSQAEDLARGFATFRRRLTRSYATVQWSLAIPHDPSQTAGWLERHLVGARLGMLVAELTVIHPESADEPAFLAPLLRGDRRTGVLENGLAALSGRRIAALLTHPRLLLALQALVLAHGGPYWDEVRPIDDRLEILAERHWQSIQAA